MLLSAEPPLCSLLPAEPPPLAALCSFLNLLYSLSSTEPPPLCSLLFTIPALSLSLSLSLLLLLLLLLLLSYLLFFLAVSLTLLFFSLPLLSMLCLQAVHSEQQSLQTLYRQYVDKTETNYVLCDLFSMCSMGTCGRLRALAPIVESAESASSRAAASNCAAQCDVPWMTIAKCRCVM